jgi:hypothetical protein
MALPSGGDDDPAWERFQSNKKMSYKDRLALAVRLSKKFLGSGSARIAVELNDGTVLKVAKTSGSGISQNKEEIRILSNPEVQKLGITIPLIDYDKVSAKWIQVAKAEAALDETELARKMGCESLENLIGLAYHISDHPKKQATKDLLKTMKISDPDMNESLIMLYAQKLAKLAEAGTILLDLVSKENWGFYRGKPVVIDVGFTEFFM